MELTSFPSIRGSNDNEREAGETCTDIFPDIAGAVKRETSDDLLVTDSTSDSSVFIFKIRRVISDLNQLVTMETEFTCYWVGINSNVSCISSCYR
jgi:hypothetical protein